MTVAAPRSRDGPGLVVDLFSGTGNATAAFRRHGWRVVTVDTARWHRPDVLADVRRLPLRLGADIGRPVDLVWASPPCTEFSDANARVDRRSLRPSLDLVFAALSAVSQLRPRFWVLENVRGAIPFLGIPVQKIGPWCLWGYFPLLSVTLPMHDYRKGACGRSAVLRAAVPYELSDALRLAIERHAGCSLLDLRPFRRHRHIAAAEPPAAAGALSLGLAVRSRDRNDEIRQPAS